jgi:hypothetical protein
MRRAHSVSVVRVLATLTLVLVPLLTAFTDPSADLVSCSGSTAVDAGAPIDIVKTTGTTVEDGQALRFTVTFAQDLPVPDRSGRPLRIDLLLKVPDIPTVSFDYYRGVNRIVRFDAVENPELQLLLLPEHAANVFSGATVKGSRLTFEFPARLIARDGDLAGFDLAGLRWSVLSRDETTCDVLGTGRPSFRLHEASTHAGASSSPTAAAAPEAGTAGSGSGGFLIACVAAVLVGGAAGFGLARWRRSQGAQPG